MSTELARWLNDNRTDPAAIIAAISLPGWLSAWDAVTGENTVVLTGTQELTNLPLICDPAQLVVNATVLVLRTPGRPVILGRLRVPPY